MANVHLSLLLALVTFHGVYQTVDAVSCAKDSDCVPTDNVLPVCSSGLCECKSGFYPIFTGCGIRLPQPTIYAITSTFNNDFKSTTEAYENATVSLRCRVSGVTDTLQYIWSENGNILAGAKAPIYEFTADINKKDATYSCKATLSNAYDSLESSSVQVTVISTDAAPTNNPRLTTDMAIPDRTFTPECEGLPFGSTSDEIVFKDGNKTLNAGTSFLVQADSQLTCQYKGMISPPLEIVKENFPKPVFLITFDYYGTSSTTAPRISVSQYGLIYMRCSYHYVSHGQSGFISHFYKNNAVIPGTRSYNILTVDTSILGEYVYACSGELTGTYPLKETKSNTITVTVKEDNLVPEPFIVRQPEVGSIGGHVSLKCVTNAIGDVKYTWSVNGKTIYAQADKTIQLHNVQFSAGHYFCTVSTDIDTSTSNTVYAATLPRPTLSTDPSDLTVNDTFSLSCQLAAAPNGINYRFYKGLKRISGTLLVVDKEDDGRYTCATFFRNLEMSRSKELVILVQDPNGNSGNRGEKGDKGDKGDSGDKGDKGDKGDSGGQSIAISLVGMLLCLVVSRLVNTLF